MSLRRARHFLRDESGSNTVEFVVIMSFFVTISFFALELALAQFYWQTAEKAAQIGARLALVSDPAVASTSSTCPATPGSLPLINCLSANSGAAAGVSCDGTASDPCANYGTITCTGGGASCNATAFTYIVNRMRQTYLPIRDSNVTISYSYLPALGFAGGPSVPSVTVTLSGVPFNTGIISILGNIIGTGAAPLYQVPPMSATMSGEDLNSSQASS